MFAKILGTMSAVFLITACGVESKSASTLRSTGEAASGRTEETVQTITFSRDLRVVDGNLTQLKLTRVEDGTYEGTLREGSRSHEVVPFVTFSCRFNRTSSNQLI